MTIAYKGFNEYLQGWGRFQYEVGNIYEWDGELEICSNGFHYCKRIVDIDWYYNLRDSRVCEVEILGSEVADDCGKFTTDRIRIVRELSREEIYKSFEDNWEELIKDEDFWVRIAVAKMGFGLDKLVNDKDWRVRKEVALKGRKEDLDILVKDVHWGVRYEVARHGRDKDLDILVHDEHGEVRWKVARYGRPEDLDILIKDKELEIRKEAVRNSRK